MLEGLLGTERPSGTPELVELLIQAYWMEIETVMSYLAALTGDNGLRGAAVMAELARGVDDEVAHTRALGRRIQELHGVLPGDFAPAELPSVPTHLPDPDAVLESVVAAELAAVRHYSRIIEAAGSDPYTHAMAAGILRDEQRHLRAFQRLLHESRQAVGA